MSSSVARTALSRRAIILVSLLALALIADTGVALAAMSCRVTVPPFHFGNYVPGDTAPLDLTGGIDVRCAGSTGAFSAALSAGSSGDFVERHLISGPSRMAYNFYVNPARTLIWGDGTNGSAPVGRVKSQPGLENFRLPVYGRIFPRQSVGAGAYTDSVIVTIIF